MIAYVNPLQSQEFVELCCVEPIIGARICSWFCCYANSYPFCDMWIIYSKIPGQEQFAGSCQGQNWPHGVAARYQGTLCIACDDQVDFVELAGFVASSGAVEVECLSNTMDRLLPHIPFVERQRQAVLKYDFDREGAPGVPPVRVLSGRGFLYSDELDCDTRDLVENCDLRGMYEVIAQCFEGFAQDSPFTSWYVDTFARIKKADSYLCGVRRKGRLVSVAGVYNISPVSAMISSVATLPDYRHRGLAKKCIRRCLEYVRYLDAVPYITAAHRELVDYYSGLGFTPCALRCSALRLREEDSFQKQYIDSLKKLQRE